MIAGVAGITLLVAACGSSSPSNSAKSKVSAAAHSSKSKSPAKGSRSAKASASPHKTTPTTSGSATLKAQHTVLGTVLATSNGSTLYGFSKDTPVASACTGTCAATWHPLTGTPRMATGVTMPGTLGTITRSGGVKQATFDGHPLYTYKDDTASGQVKGENTAEFGGRWLTIPVVTAVTPGAPVTPTKPAIAPSKPGGMPSKPGTAPSHTRGGGAGP